MCSQCPEVVAMSAGIINEESQGGEWGTGKPSRWAQALCLVTQQDAGRANTALQQHPQS